MTQGYASEREVDWGAVAGQSRMPYDPKPKPQPKVDAVVSRIVGRNVLVNDPKLIKLVVKWKANKPADSLQPDDFLRSEKKIKELKREFG